jgi:hypothetical protein
MRESASSIVSDAAADLGLFRLSSMSFYDKYPAPSISVISTRHRNSENEEQRVWIYQEYIKRPPFQGQSAFSWVLWRSRVAEGVTDEEAWAWAVQQPHVPQVPYQPLDTAHSGKVGSSAGEIVIPELGVKGEEVNPGLASAEPYSKSTQIH